MKFLSLILVFICFAGFAQNDRALVANALNAIAAEHNLSQNDVAEFEISSKSSSKAKGVVHIYIVQKHQGFSISNAKGNLTFKNDELLFHNLNFISGVSDKVYSSGSKLSPVMALEEFLKSMNLPYQALTVNQASENLTIVSKNEVALEDISISKTWFLSDKGLELCYDLNVYTLDAKHWYSARINAENGTILFLNDWVLNCQFASTENHAAHQHKDEVNLIEKPNASAPKAVSQYRVFAIPTESPNHGPHELVTDPHSIQASPFGWHDVDGIAGSEYNISRGNNVYAYEDISDNDSPGMSVNGGATNLYDFNYNVAQTASQNLDAAITNLFYMNNIMHDVYFNYGFDEASGNFQFNNYSGDGQDDDDVMAEAQDGSGTNNANFATPPDGFNPRMQMYLWSSTTNNQLLTVNSPPILAGDYTTTYAAWSQQITTPITADFALVDDNVTDPQDGCETLINSAEIVGKIAVIRRGSCTFIEKGQAAEAAGAVGVIIVNNTGGNPISMGGTGSVGIPVLMVTQTAGERFIDSLLANVVINGTLNGTGSIIANDSDFDNGIIAHEYGHGISNRLTGGGDDTDCLYNEEQMGEGWSDWFGLMLTMQPNATATQNRGVGTYVTNEPTNGEGIRPAAYNTNFAVNNYTYASTNNSSISQPHGIGFVWASMLWDLNWALIDEYGFDPDVYNGNGGNNVALTLVTEGLKLQPCAPGFVDGRDAILEADMLLYNGANQCLIWEVFANRGLGLSADQGNSDNRFDQVEAFDEPICDPISTAGITDVKANLISVYPNPNNGEFYIQSNDFEGINTISLSDLSGKVLFEQKALVASKTLINVARFSKGMYLLNYNFEGKQFVKRIVIE